MVLRDSEQLGPNGLSGAVHGGRRRHGTDDIEKSTNGSSDEAEKTKKTKLETTSADNAIAQRRKEDNSSGYIYSNAGGRRQAVGGSSDGDGSSNGGAGSAGRDKGVGWRRRERRGLTLFSWGCAQMATCFTSAGEAR